MIRKQEELIGVKIPGQGGHIVRVMVGALEADEDILKRISTVEGTVFSVAGQRYEVVKSSPFTLKDLSASQNDVKPAKTKRLASKREVPAHMMPVVGEAWRPKDPRRVASFKVAAVNGDIVTTDDGRNIQLARFSRYVRS